MDTMTECCLPDGCRGVADSEIPLPIGLVRNNGKGEGYQMVVRFWNRMHEGP